jgi:hypothetical protein
VVAWELPQILTYLDAQQREQHSYLCFIQSEEQMLDYQKLGHEVYFLEGLDYHYLQTHGVNIVKLGAKPLFAENSTLEAGRGQ